MRLCITTIFCLFVFLCSAQQEGVYTIHVFVALCDNKYQGIVPVPARIGNGQDPDNNLYWGCGFGVRSYFKSSKEWKLVEKVKHVNDTILERVIFRHASGKWYLVADAYDGRMIKQCTEDFLSSCSGGFSDTVQVKGISLGTGGNAKLVAYIGHDGLMDFSLANNYVHNDGKRRDAVILACFSKKYFASHLAETGANPLLWTTNLMSPEAYTLHDALTGYINGESRQQINLRAAQAYARYQKCSIKAASRLLVSGW